MFKLTEGFHPSIESGWLFIPQWEISLGELETKWPKPMKRGRFRRF